MRATRAWRVVRMGAAENRAHERFRHERDTLSDPRSGVGGSAFAVDPRVCCVGGWGARGFVRARSVPLTSSSILSHAFAASPYLFSRRRFTTPSMASSLSQ